MATPQNELQQLTTTCLSEVSVGRVDQIPISDWQQMSRPQRIVSVDTVAW
jgi:hypothetical protein